MKLGRITAKDLREKYILPKGIMKFKRLRQIWIKVLGFWFFKDISSQTAKNQVIKIDDDIHTQDDINNYMAKLVTLKLNFQSPLWEIHVKEDYDENTSIMFFVVHHILTDGMGSISLFSFMNDSHNPDNISQFKSIPFYFSYIAPILYLPIGIVKFTYAAMQTKKDPNMKAFSLKGGVQTRNKKYYESKRYPLSELKKGYNMHKGVKLNGYILSSVSVAFSKYLSELGISEEKQTHISCAIPANLKPQPRCIDDVQFNNGGSISLINIPLSSNIDYVISKIVGKLKSRLSLSALQFGVSVFGFVGHLPEAAGRFLTRDNSTGLNLVISNVPGPQTTIYFGDKEVVDMGGVGPNVGTTGLTILITSYRGLVKMQVLADKDLQMDPQEFIRHFEDQIDQSIVEANKLI